MTTTRNDTKKANVEQDLAKFKEEVGERFEKLETMMGSMRTESEARHAELMQLLLQQNQSSKPQPAPAAAPPPPYTATQPPFTATQPPPSSAAIPVFQASNLVFDDLGFPIAPFAESSSANRGAYRSFTNQDVQQTGPMGSGFMNTGPPPFLSGFGRGSGPMGERTWLPGTDYRLRKLKMPLFDGEDAYGWVYRIERFFDIQGFVTTGEKLRAAVLCMEGQALAWFRWSDGRNPFRHWEDLKGRILDRFQPSQEGDIYEQFLAIKQEGTARDYVGTFEALATQLEGIPERVMEGTFIKGLDQDLRTSVRLLQPTGLNQAIKLALMVDESRSGSQGEIRKGSTKGQSALTGGMGT